MCLFLDEFFEISSNSNMESGTTASLSRSYAWWWLRAQVSSKVTSSTKVEKTSYFTIASMRIERYYASVREDVTEISPPAVQLLDRQDYVSFFKACGPTYVRGIRRAQEVTAMLKYESTSTESAREYSRSVQTNYGYNSGYKNNAKFASVNKSLTITIKAYGLGLTESGAESLLATSMQEFNEIMLFAYNQMTKSPYANHVGMVYGIEVAPWVENIEFQIVSKVQDEAIEIPQAKSLIPLAYSRTNSSDFNFDNSDPNARTNYRCKDLSYAIDKYGYCCEFASLYDFSTEEYDENNPEARICRPVRSLDKSMVTENMATNGEFVARLDRALRYKMNQMSVMEKCISAVQGIPERLNHHFLKPQDSVKYDKEVDGIFTVFDMRNAIDPFGDYSIVRHMASELDEFIEMFYSPCLQALFGSKVGKSSSTEPSYFMAYPWHTHEECSKLSCLASNMRWDRDNGGCIPSLLSGSSAKGYNETSTNANKHCAKEVTDAGTLACKHNSEALGEFHAKITRCWNATLPSGSVNYFIEHFCMPQVTANALSGDEKEALEEEIQNSCVP